MTATPILHNDSAPSYAAKHGPVRGERAWLGWLAGSDPGLTRLRMAAELQTRSRPEPSPRSRPNCGR